MEIAEPIGVWNSKMDYGWKEILTKPIKDGKDLNGREEKALDVIYEFVSGSQYTRKRMDFAQTLRLKMTVEGKLPTQE